MTHASPATGKRMISLFAVVSPPRSGTKWYAKLFSDRDVFCFHELTTLLHAWPARAILRHAFDKDASTHSDDQLWRRFFLDASPSYFNRLFEQGERGMRVVGNSDNTLVDKAAGMWLLWPETRFVFSTRNGINQVNSALVNELRLPALVASTRRPRVQRGCHGLRGRLPQLGQHDQSLGDAAKLARAEGRLLPLDHTRAGHDGVGRARACVALRGRRLGAVCRPGRRASELARQRGG